MIGIISHTRELLLWLSDTPGTVRHCLPDISPVCRIDSYGARFSKPQHTLRSARYRDITPLMKEVLCNKNDTDIPVIAAFRK